MGSFIITIGNPNIPENKWPEFQANIIHIMDIGGMMQLEEVRMFDKSALLLDKVKYDEEYKCYWANYNYLEDDRWEDMGINPKTRRVFSNKVGWSTFNRVTGLCHMLEELYSDGQCFVGGDLYLEPLEMVIWINKEFGKDFNLDHRLDIQNA